MMCELTRCFFIPFFMCFLMHSNTKNSVEAGIFDWFWGSEVQDVEPRKISSTPLVTVPFETKSDDEKFLQEAAKYTSLKLSDLDVCQHKVVMKIRGSCSSMSEEELAKMSVNLLNCQSSVEGRQEFPCTDSMTIRECTTTMDSDTWNAYHLMNNRARAVCYAARHQQFRALSEMTVNKLMSSAHDQLAAMAILKEGQYKLESMTSNTIEVVAEGHKTLAEQQERLRNTQQSIQNFVELNLRQLTREKALIAAGHSELARLTSDVKSQLDAANQQLNAQAAERRVDHQELVKDLVTIQQQAQIIWEQIEQSTNTILSQHVQAMAQYEDTLVKLKRINETVNFLLQLVDQTRLELDIRLEWISSLMGGTGDRIERVYTCLLHGVFLLTGMIAAAFLQAPMLARVCLLLIVPCNLALTFNQGPEKALDYFAMTMIIIASAVVQWVFGLVWSAVSAEKTQPAKPLTLMDRGRLLLEDLFLQLNWRFYKTPTNKLTAADEPRGGSVPRRVQTWLSNQSGYSESKARSRTDDSSESDAAVDEDPMERRSVLRQRTGSQYQSPPTPSHTPSRSATPGTLAGAARPFCVAICRNGQSCRNSAIVNGSVCKRHISSPYH